MIGIKSYVICDRCAASTTKKANGDQGKALMDAIKDGWTTRLSERHYCPDCSKVDTEAPVSGVFTPTAETTNTAPPQQEAPSTASPAAEAPTTTSETPAPAAPAAADY